MKLHTLGYEGLYIDDFVSGVKKFKLDLIVDIRRNPISRKKGFSKRKLAEALSTIKVEYLHFKNLGVPAEWRKKAKAKIITRKQMFTDYEKRILPKQKATIQHIYELAQEKNLALLCYEKEASDCHRSYLVKELNKLAKKKLKVVNLTIRGLRSM